MNAHSSACYVIDADYNVVSVNETIQKLYPQLQVGKKCHRCLMGLDEPCGPCPVAGGVKGPRTYTDPIRHISEIVDAVDVPIEGHGLCHALVLSTVENEAAFAATLPTSSEGLKNLALVKSLTVDYYDVSAVNLSDGTMVMYRHDGQAVETDDVLHKPRDYAAGNEDYISKYVYVEDQAMMRERSRLEYLRQLLKTTESATIHYRVVWQGKLHYFFRKTVRIGDADSFDNIVVGVCCEDDTILSQQRQIALQDNLRKVEYSIATGLLTREAFFIHGSRLLEKFPDTEYDCCVLRLENLGSINHQYGRITGDKTIQTVGQCLKAYQQEGSCVAYFGDGLFVCLIEGKPTEERKLSVYALREHIVASCEVKNLTMKWSVYRGVDRKAALDESFERISYALSSIRPNMRQEYVEFDQDIMNQMEWNAYVEDHFRKALADGEFVTWFQPKYSVHTQGIIGAEALVRWRRPNGEMVPPGKFIPVLENCGLINLLDEEVFRQVCILQRELSLQGKGMIPISVNLSRASIFTNDIAQSYSGIAEFYGVDPHRIPIEITESAAVRAAMIRQFADSLISKGFVLHMDDFGSGYSSLASLQAIPFESIKLDKTLIDFIGKRSGENLLKHTIAFAKESGLSIVAEGVETLEQYVFLKFAGCDAIQGFYFSKPVPQDEFLRMLG